MGKEPIIGYRLWRYNDFSNDLRYLFRIGAWKSGSNKAQCLNNFSEGKASPEPNCQCGLNAFYLLEQETADKLYQHLEYFVQGAVAGSGLVYLHEGGWRAEEAQIIALYCPAFLHDKIQDKIHDIGRNYQVPVFEKYSDLINFASSLGFTCHNPPAVKEAVEHQFADILFPNKRFRISNILFRKKMS